VHTGFVQLVTSDGVPLHAVHTPSPDMSTCVVLAHGFTNSIATPHVRAIAAGLAREGVGVLSFDFRGHGRSGGLSTVGDAEVHDVDAAVTAARRLGYARVVTCGWSMGGAVVIRHAAGQGTVHLPDAVIAVSPLARWHYRGTKAMRRVMYAIERPSGRWFVRRFMRTRISPRPWDPDVRAPFECAPLVEVPFLLVHGDADHYFPLDHPEQIVAEAPDVEYWLEEGMGHAEAAATPDLIRRLAAFSLAVDGKRGGEIGVG
jgi:pimeloyl-ACP methyl ester carboxylesterase